MKPTYILFVSLCIFHVNTAPNGYCNNPNTGEKLFLSKFKIPKETKSPINIDTKNVTFVDYRSPLLMVANPKDRIFLTNTGKSVEGVNPNPHTESHITGGVLKSKIYRLSRVKYLWTDNKNGSCGTRIDGKGYRLEVIAYSFNTKYKTWDNSLNYRDGLVKLVIPMIVGCTPNKDFLPLSENLKQITKAETTIITTLDKVVWHFHSPPNSTYYVYPGGYRDECSGKVHYCETVIVLAHNVHGYISEQQFEETFGRMKNYKQQPLISTEKLQPTKTVVVEARGVNETIVGMDDAHSDMKMHDGHDT